MLHRLERAQAEEKRQHATSDEEKEKAESEILNAEHWAEVAWELFQHEESAELVQKALRLNVGGWPEDESLYEEPGRRGKILRLNDKGFEYLRDKVTKEEKRRREAWNDRVGMITSVVTALTGLGGVIIGILSVSC